MLDIRLVSIEDQIEGDERSSVKRLQAAFGVDARIARFFLANIPIFVKRNATTDEAKAYVQALHVIGAEVEIHRAAQAPAVGSADRFQPDAMEKLRAAQAKAQDDAESFDERPDRYPDSVAPFMNEVPDAFPKSMDIREMTSPPGFDSRLGDAEMEQLMSYMPDDGDSSIGPLTMDLPDGYSLDAFQEFGMGEASLEEFGEIDAMGELDDEDFPLVSPPSAGARKEEAPVEPMGVEFGFDDLDDLGGGLLGDSEFPSLQGNFPAPAIEGNAPPPAIEGNSPPPPMAAPEALSNPIPFPDDLLDAIGTDVDPDAIAVAATPSFTRDIDELLDAPRDDRAQNTVEENVNDLFPDGVPSAASLSAGPRTRTTQPELPVRSLLSVPQAQVREPGVPPPPAPPSRPVARTPLVPALPREMDDFVGTAPAVDAPAFWDGVFPAALAPVRGAGAAWLGILAVGCFVCSLLVALPIGALMAGVGILLTPVLIGGLARYFTLSVENGLQDDATAPPLSADPRPSRPHFLAATLAMAGLALVLFAAPAWAALQLVTATQAATEASAPLSDWDPDQVWYDEGGKVLVLTETGAARVAYTKQGAKVLVDPRRKVIHHIDEPRSQQRNPDLPKGPLLVFLAALLLPLLYWPMALSVSAVGGSQGNVFNPVFVGAAMVKGGIGYAFVALGGALVTIAALGACAAMLSNALVGGTLVFLIAALVIFSAIVPVVHGIQGQWMGRLLADRRDTFTHFSGL
jgi:hypothetical protein